MGLGAVGGALTIKIVPFHRALEAFALGDADDVDVVARLDEAADHREGIDIHGEGHVAGRQGLRDLGRGFGGGRREVRRRERGAGGDGLPRHAADHIGCVAVGVERLGKRQLHQGDLVGSDLATERDVGRGGDDGDRFDGRCLSRARPRAEHQHTTERHDGKDDAEQEHKAVRALQGGNSRCDVRPRSLYGWREWRAIIRKGYTR